MSCSLAKSRRARPNVRVSSMASIFHLLRRSRSSERFADPHDVSNHHHTCNAVGHVCVRQVRNAPRPDPLVGCRCAADDRRGCACTPALSDQLLRELRTAPDAHQHDERHRIRLDGAQASLECVSRMARHDEKSRRGPAMCYRNAREFRCGDRSAHAGNDFEWNTRHRERQCFLRAAAEDKWISALETHDTLAGARRPNHQTVNRVLPDALTPRALADAEALRVGESPQRLRVYQRVIEHEIGLLEIGNGAPRPEVRIAWSRADQRHLGIRWDLGFGIWDLGFALVQAIQNLEQLRTTSLHPRALLPPHKSRLVGSLQPLSDLTWQQRIERFAHETRNGRCTAVGRNRNRHPVTAYNTTEIGRRMLRIVNGVDEDPPPLGSLADTPIHRRRRRRDNPPCSVEISVDELSPDNPNSRFLNLGPDIRSDHGDARSRGDECLDLSCGDGATPYHDGFAAGQIEERGKHDAHTDAGTFRRDPTTRSKSASDRPILVGAATRSRTTSAVL